MKHPDEANRAFQQAAQEDKGKGYGGDVPRKPRNPLYAANKELAELADSRHPVPADLGHRAICPNCGDKGCPYCDKAEQ